MDRCAVDPEIMGPFHYSEDGNSAKVNFQAHKFPYTDSVYYHCNVHLCLKADDGCPSVSINLFIFKTTFLNLFIASFHS